jgi:hypothetical protein
VAGTARRASLIAFCALLFSPVFLAEAHGTGCILKCQLTADTNVPPGQATVWVLVDNTNYTTLPTTLSFLSGTVHILRIMNQSLPGANGAIFVWKQWSQNATGNTYTPSGVLTTPPMLFNYTAGHAGKFIAEYTKLFKLSLSFTDPSGQPVAPPSSVTLQSGATTIMDSNYSGMWLEAKNWKVANATWEGDPDTESGTASFNLSAGPVTGTLVLKAYNAIINVVDLSSRPLPNATVIVNFSNSTVRSFLTDTDGLVQLGHVPLGPYSVQINYQGQNMGTWNADASSSPTLVAMLNTGGSSSGPQINLFSSLRTYWYLVALGFVAGFAGVGAVVRVRGRKPNAAENSQPIVITTSA